MIYRYKKSAFWIRVTKISTLSQIYIRQYYTDYHQISEVIYQSLWSRQTLTLEIKDILYPKPVANSRYYKTDKSLSYFDSVSFSYRLFVVLFTFSSTINNYAK